MKKMKWLTPDEIKLVANYREGNARSEEQKEETKEETKETDSEEKKEEKEMKGSTKKGLKIAGIVTAGVAALGGIGYGIYKAFFEDPEGLNDFEDYEEDDEDLDDEDDLFEDEADAVAPAAESKENTES